MSLQLKSMENIERIKHVVEEILSEIYIIEQALCDISHHLNINSESIKIMCEIYDEN